MGVIMRNGIVYSGGGSNDAKLATKLAIDLENIDQEGIEKIKEIARDGVNLDNKINTDDIPSIMSDYGIKDKTQISGIETDIANLEESIVEISTKEDSTNKVTSLSASSTDIQYPSAKAVYTSLENKVDKVNGKQLSTNDYTTADKNKLSAFQTADNYATKDDLDNAINDLPEPMIFKGTLGTSGTITELPSAAQRNGYTYKAISAGSDYKVGDTLISNGTEWVIIPSGDEPDELVEITKAEYDKISDRETNGVVYLVTDWDQVSNESGTVPVYEIATESEDGLMSKRDKFKLNHLVYGRKDGTTIGENSTAEGYGTTASGSYSHAEGYGTTASGSYSHAEGYYTTASGSYSHAEGYYTTASNSDSHAEGYYTTASGSYSHAEGTSENKITAIIPDFTSSTSNSTITSAWNSKKFSLAKGASSHVEGKNCLALGDDSHAEGYATTASELCAHAEGRTTKASSSDSHAEGNQSTASGTCSHAEGNLTTASGSCSHAEGYRTTASNYGSHAGGHYNVAMTNGGESSNTTGTAFVIGNGTATNALSNAFSVQYNGTVKANSTITASTTADYAEFFEWLDGNLSSEDRVGRFVTIAFGEGNYKQIRYANSTDNYILGITSGHPFVLGNGDCDTWNGMYTYDDFNRIITEPAPLIKRTVDEETGETKEIPVLNENGEQVYQGTRPVINPNYDPEIEYISRFDRPEWEPVAMMGVVSVYDDGTCEVGQYCKPSDNDGIATISDKETKFMVIRRIRDNIVEVIIK